LDLPINSKEKEINMNKKIANVLCYVVLIFLFSACKKEKSETPDIHSIDLFVLNPYRIDSTGPTSYTYKLRGTIVSPVKLEITDYGFFVKDNGFPKQVKLGSAYKEGYVENDYPSAYQLNQSDVTMYAILKRGDTLYSSASSSATNFPVFINPNPQVSFNLNPLPSNDILLNSTFTYDASSNYSVGAYDLLYKQSTAPNFTSFTLIPYGTTLNNFSLLQKLGITPGVTYDFQINVLLIPPSGSSAGPVPYTSQVQSASY
jgi:hypothetical protein